jgi:hypothetical protein
LTTGTTVAEVGQGVDLTAIGGVLVAVSIAAASKQANKQ